MHIFQSNSLTGDIYVVVNTEGFEGDLNQHPSVVEHPELFVVSNSAPPDDRLIYTLIYTS